MSRGPTWSGSPVYYLILFYQHFLISGKKLRKVERNDEVKQREYGSDVASILARRIVIEVSDTESDSEGSDSSDAEWSD